MRPWIIGAATFLVGGVVIVWHLLVWGATDGEIHRALFGAQSVVAAEASYAEANLGWFDGNLKCLERPSICRPDDQRASLLPASLSREFDPSKDGDFFAGPPVPTADTTRLGASATSIRSFVYLVAPARRAPWWARYSVIRLPPAFCGDHRGRVCALPPNFAFAVLPLTCPSECRD